MNGSSMIVGSFSKAGADISGADPGFLPGESINGLMTLYGKGMSDFGKLKHRFATFQDVYCHIMLEWC